MTSQHAVLNAKYFDSVVQRAILVFGFELHTMGHPAYLIIYPVLHERQSLGLVPTMTQYLPSMKVCVSKTLDPPALVYIQNPTLVSRVLQIPNNTLRCLLMTHPWIRHKPCALMHCKLNLRSRCCSKIVKLSNNTVHVKLVLAFLSVFIRCRIVSAGVSCSL